MRRSFRAGITAMVLTGGTLVAVAAPAEAAAAVLYVRKASAACSDSGPGTPQQPITFQSELFAIVSLSGPAAGFVIDGQHDIRIRNIAANGVKDAPVLDIRDS